MPNYDKFHIPQKCYVGNTIFKKLFYENADLSSYDKSLFVDSIIKITWIYCLKPETINITIYTDDIREYPEIEVIEVVLNSDKKLKRISEIIMKTIPYPMILIFKIDDKSRIYTAHQRISQSDNSKNTIEEFIFTDWLTDDSTIYDNLDIRNMRFANFYTFYSDFIDTISIHNLSQIAPERVEMTGEVARNITNKVAAIDQEINRLRAILKKESQFNRKIELNITIKNLEKNKKDTIGGLADD